MFSFHKPKIYRSGTGCCICRAKSSSSRFTDSGKYQPYFEACFHLEEERSGDICNACVLLVKRFRKLPSGLLRHWGHVVDARANTKVRPKISIVQKTHQIEDEEEAGGDDAEDDDDIKLVSKVIRKKRREKREEKHWNRSRSKITNKIENQMPSFLDPQLWHRETVCCGTIFRGPMNAIVIDTNNFRPCMARRSSREESVSSSSLSGGASPSSSGSPVATSSQIHFKMDTDKECVSGGDSEPETVEFDQPFESQNGHSKMAVPAAL
ncbi:hypothetical protein GHT06_012782 [Daphnia sinensis]|uniref:Protein FAM60A n=1 Tax=Daphnia sinensis TaxID=1820382 RepID=A0AAD5LFJ6_9CRUS|nr:hypothetical protein GHT06_012782 [Daphnia sinensis]